MSASELLLAQFRAYTVLAVAKREHGLCFLDYLWRAKQSLELHNKYLKIETGDTLILGAA